PTLVVTRTGDEHARGYGAHVERVTVARGEDGTLELTHLLHELRARGLRRIFIEGGGVTGSHFLPRGLLDRLDLAGAPQITGSAVAALSVAPIECMNDAITARCRRFALGSDMLFDCDLRTRST